MEKQLCLLSQGLNWSQVKTQTGQAGHTACRVNTQELLTSDHSALSEEDLPHVACLILHTPGFSKTWQLSYFLHSQIQTPTHTSTLISRGPWYIFTCLEGFELLQVCHQRAMKTYTFILHDPTLKPNLFTAGWSILPRANLIMFFCCLAAFKAGILKLNNFLSYTFHLSLVH